MVRFYVSNLFTGFRLQNTKCMLIVDMWKRLHHSNIVQLKEVFTTKAFGDNCMYFEFINTLLIWNNYKILFMNKAERTLDEYLVRNQFVRTCLYMQDQS